MKSSISFSARIFSSLALYLFIVISFLFLVLLFVEIDNKTEDLTSTSKALNALPEKISYVSIVNSEIFIKSEYLSSAESLLKKTVLILVFRTFKSSLIRYL